MAPSALFNGYRWSSPMSQDCHFDASGSLTALEQDSTIIAVIVMSQAKWLVAALVPGVEPQPLKKFDAHEETLLNLLHRWRREAAFSGAIRRLTLRHCKPYRLTTISGFCAQEDGALSESIDVSRRLVAVFAADVEGYSRLMGADEVGTLKGLTERRAILDKVIAAHRGRIANTAGDSVLAEFGSAVDAVQCAMEAQAALTKANSSRPVDKHINFRIGIHVGDVIVRAGDLFGDGVNIAARLQALAQPGGVCVSSATYEQVRKVVPIAFTDLGAQQVKNIEDPVRAYAAGEHTVATRGGVGAADRPLPLPDKPSIAVLPFQNMSGDPEQEFFADGMVEEIITALSRFKSLFVIARNSSFTYKGRAVDVKRVGRELGVRYVLEGSVRKAANRLRITGQLVDTATGAQLWADRFDGGLGDIFDLQDQVTENVVGAIAPAVERAEIERAKRKPTESLDAYTLYLRGLARLYQFANRQAIEDALRLFNNAIELDPDFASAHGRAAVCYARAKGQGWISGTADEIAEVSRLARRAVELGKDDAIALVASGWALAYVARDRETGAALIDRALVLNSNLFEAWSFGGWAKIYLGEPEAAIERFARAMRLSPLDPWIIVMRSGTAHAHFFLGRYDEAVSWAAIALRDDPDHQPSLRVGAASNAMTGRLEQAQKAVARLLLWNPALRVSNLRDVLGPYRRAEDLSRYEEGLRKAGLPE
jgi:adenylate cyclase